MYLLSVVQIDILTREPRLIFTIRRGDSYFEIFNSSWTKKSYFRSCKTGAIDDIFCGQLWRKIFGMKLINDFMEFSIVRAINNDAIYLFNNFRFKVTLKRFWTWLFRSEYYHFAHCMVPNLYNSGSRKLWLLSNGREIWVTFRMV